MKMNRKIAALLAMTAIALAALAATPAGAQVLAADQLKKAVPASFFFSGQVATVQMRNSGGFKNAAAKLTIAGLVDTTGYATAISEKYQGFLITETKLAFEGGTLDPGAYGFGFKDGKFVVMNVAGTEVLSIVSHKDDQVKHPVPLKFEKSEAGFKLWAGRNWVEMKVD